MTVIVWLCVIAYTIYTVIVWTQRPWVTTSQVRDARGRDANNLTLELLSHCSNPIDRASLICCSHLTHPSEPLVLQLWALASSPPVPLHFRLLRFQLGSTEVDEPST